MFDAGELPCPPWHYFLAPLMRSNYRIRTVILFKRVARAGFRLGDMSLWGNFVQAKNLCLGSNATSEPTGSYVGSLSKHREAPSFGLCWPFSVGQYLG